MTHVSPAARVGRYGHNGVAGASQASSQARLEAGQHLYPSASDYSARTNGGRSQNQNDDQNGKGNRFNHRRHPYFRTGLYYPYIYGGFLPGYGGYADGGAGFHSGLDAAETNGVANGQISGDAAESSGSGYWDRNVPAEPTQPAPSTDAVPLPANQPDNVGPEAPNTTARSASADSGPDSLVEAVQDELAKRGYFAGKVDSVYGESTSDALRRFQSDRKLNPTGRINEATLHALQLD